MHFQKKTLRRKIAFFRNDIRTTFNLPDSNAFTGLVALCQFDAGEQMHLMVMVLLMGVFVINLNHQGWIMQIWTMFVHCLVVLKKNMGLHYHEGIYMLFGCTAAMLRGAGPVGQYKWFIIRCINAQRYLDFPNPVETASLFRRMDMSIVKLLR